MNQASKKAGKPAIDNQRLSEVGFAQARISREGREPEVCQHPNQWLEKNSAGEIWQLCCAKGCNLRLFVRKE